MIVVFNTMFNEPEHVSGCIVEVMKNLFPMVFNI